MTILEKLERLERIKADPDFAVIRRRNPELSRVVDKLDAIRREAPGTVRAVEEILRDIEGIEFEKLGLADGGKDRSGEWGSFFRTARSLNLEGPSDWSERFEEYLYGDRS